MVRALWRRGIVAGKLASAIGGRRDGRIEEFWL